MYNQTLHRTSAGLNDATFHLVTCQISSHGYWVLVCPLKDKPYIRTLGRKKTRKVMYPSKKVLYQTRCSNKCLKADKY